MESLNEAGLYGSESLAQSSPGAYSLYIQEAKDKGVSTDQALKYATAATAMEIGTRNMPIDVLLDSMDGDPKRAAQVLDDALRQLGIEMTPEELNWLGNVAAEASVLQQDPAFIQEIALNRLTGMSEGEAQTAASQALWQEAMDRVIALGISDFDLEGKEGQRQPVEAIDTGAVSEYNKENQQEPDFEIGKSLSAKAKNYDVLDLETGEVYHFAEDTKIQNVEVFAGKGTKKEFRTAQKYADKYGGRPEDWQHTKGFGLLATPDGDKKAEVHWVQCPGVGKFEFFVKKWNGE